MNFDIRISNRFGLNLYCFHNDLLRLSLLAGGNCIIKGLSTSAVGKPGRNMRSARGLSDDRRLAVYGVDAGGNTGI